MRIIRNAGRSGYRQRVAFDLDQCLRVHGGREDDARRACERTRDQSVRLVHALLRSRHSHLRFCELPGSLFSEQAVLN